MRKTNFKQIFGIFILYILGASPLAITYSYAEMDMGDLKRDSIQEENWKIIITEKVVNGKLQVKQYTFPKNTSTLDIQRILSLEGENDWVYASHGTYQYGIVLFDGKSSNVDGFSTKILSDEGLEFWNSESFKDKEISYKVIFSGKMVETNVDMNSVISIMNLGWKILQLTQNTELNLVSFQNLNHIDFSQKMNSDLGKII